MRVNQQLQKSHIVEIIKIVEICLAKLENNTIIVFKFCCMF